MTLGPQSSLPPGVARGDCSFLPVPGSCAWASRPCLAHDLSSCLSALPLGLMSCGGVCLNLSLREGPFHWFMNLAVCCPHLCRIKTGGSCLRVLSELLVIQFLDEGSWDHLSSSLPGLKFLRREEKSNIMDIQCYLHLS